MKDLDAKDRQILFELDRGCRQSVNELAKKLRISRDVVRYRINRLEERKYISGYIALIDFTKLGYQIVRLYIKLQNTTKRMEEEIIHHLLDQETVIIAYRTDGKYEIAIGLLVKDLREYQKTYDDFLQRYRPHIVEKDFTVFSDFIQYFRNYLTHEKNMDYAELSTGSHIPFDYDDTDILMLKEISTDAKMPLIELSRRLGLPVNTAKYRLKNLEKRKVIVAYRALIDYHRLGYEYYKVDLIIEDLSIIPSLKEYIRKHPNVIFRDVAIGGNDFEFDCELRNQDEFYAMIEEIRDMFPEKIRSFFYYKAIRIYKYSYFPKLILKELKEEKKR